MYMFGRVRQVAAPGLKSAVFVGTLVDAVGT